MKARFEEFIPYAIGFMVALSIFSAILLVMGLNPISGLETILYGSFGTIYSAAETFVRATPLLLTALAFAIAFKAEFWNIGAEGQLYMGALTAFLVASQVGGLPSVLSIPLIALASFLGGMAWLAIPLVLRIKQGINEIFLTVVMNFIAIFIIGWLTTGPIKDPISVNPQTIKIPLATWLPNLIPGTRLHVGIIFAFFFAFLVYLILYKTILGYEIRTVGLSSNAARHGGINLSKVIVSVGILSGGLAGLAGMVEVVGTHHLLIEGISPGYGFQGIAISALGGFHPIGIIVASIFFSSLLIGGETMQRGAGVPFGVIYILQAVIVLSILIIRRWMVTRRR